MLAMLPAPEAVVGNPAAALVILFALLIVHAVCDYPLQGEFLAKAKNRRADLSGLFGKRPVPCDLWPHALSAHSLIHAGGVWLVTGSVALAGIEFLVHCVIDFVKCEGAIGFTADQALHWACKVVYAVLLYFGPAWVIWTPS